MDPQKYLVAGTNLQVAKIEEWFGRRWGRDYASQLSVPFVYPIPPETWIGPPPEPPPEAFTWFYTRAKPLAPSGGVFVLDDDIMRWATEPEVLSDEQSFEVDVAAEAKTYEQLSPAEQAALEQ